MSNQEPIVHVGNCSERRNIWNPREIIYAEEWEKKNALFAHGDASLLHLLLNEYDDNYYGLISPISQRDAFVAATVIQWLGTNIGQGFIEECQKKIKESESGYKAAQEFILKMKK